MDNSQGTKRRRKTGWNSPTINIENFILKLKPGDTFTVSYLVNIKNFAPRSSHKIATDLVKAGYLTVKRDMESRGQPLIFTRTDKTR